MEEVKTDFKTKLRLNQLMFMHNMMLESKNEQLRMYWFEYVPNKPSEYEFLAIAENHESYNKILDVFAEIVSNDNFVVEWRY